MEQNPAWHEIIEDHRGKRVLARRAREGAKSEQDELAMSVFVETIALFEREVEPHFLREESGIFPALEALGERSIVERARAEHDAIREMLRAARPHAPRAALLLLAESLERHVDFEERDMVAVMRARLR